MVGQDKTCSCGTVLEWVDAIKEEGRQHLGGWKPCLMHRAAPALLAALEEISAFAEAGHPTRGLQALILQRARTAIAQARVEDLDEADTSDLGDERGPNPCHVEGVE